MKYYYIKSHCYGTGIVALSEYLQKIPLHMQRTGTLQYIMIRGNIYFYSPAADKSILDTIKALQARKDKKCSAISIID